MKFILITFVIILPIALISFFYIYINDNDYYPGADYRNYDLPKFELTELYSNADISNEDLEGTYLINVWASWCIPCRAEMPNASILKDKLKGKNIVFLYLGYNDKEKAWLKARDQIGIQGEHYLLDDKMIREAEELFVINGIPHYAIIDKDGKIISKSAGRPREAYKELLDLVNK